MATGSTVFVDTNVLVYAEDGSAPEKNRRAHEWMQVLWRRRCGRLSTQVLNEYYAVVTRKLRPTLQPGDARAEVRRYQHWRPWQVDHQTVETAWAVESRFQVSWWDALVVASAIHQGCQYLLSEDLQHGQQIDSVQVINPFLCGPEILDGPEPHA